MFFRFCLWLGSGVLMSGPLASWATETPNSEPPIRHGPRKKRFLALKKKGNEILSVDQINTNFLEVPVIIKHSRDLGSCFRWRKEGNSDKKQWQGQVAGYFYFHDLFSIDVFFSCFRVPLLKYRLKMITINSLICDAYAFIQSILINNFYPLCVLTISRPTGC